ncbi:MAG: hypothetical protein ACREQ9_26955, partial [Candidatus Binatia bacterium]
MNAPAPWVSFDEVHAGEPLTVAGMITFLDVDGRALRLKTAEGLWPKLRVDDRVMDLQRLRAGDWVVAHYYEDTLLEIRRPVLAGHASGAALAARPGAGTLGRLPGSIAAFTHTIAAKV